METFWQDLRYGVRALARTPAFTAVAILTLGLGIGANAAIFSVTRAVLLSPLPYADTQRTVAIWSRWADFDKTWVSEAELLDYRQARSLRDAGAWSTTQANLTGSRAEPERVGAARVTPNVFTARGRSTAARSRRTRRSRGATPSSFWDTRSGSGGSGATLSCCTAGSAWTGAIS